MKKKLNETAIASELRQGSAFFRDAAPLADDTDGEGDAQPVNQPMEAPVAQPASRSTTRSSSQSTGRSSHRSTDTRSPFDTSTILGRPKAFYITEQQDRDLDAAVDKLTERLRGRANQKIDRSTVVRLVLELSNLTDDETADRLAGQFVSRLVSQLTG